MTRTTNTELDWEMAGVKLKKIVGGVHISSLPTNRFCSSPICRQIGFSFNFISNALLASTIDI